MKNVCLSFKKQNIDYEYIHNIYPFTDNLCLLLKNVSTSSVYCID